MIGMHGTVSAAWAVERCDNCWSASAPASLTALRPTPSAFAPSAKVIHVDIDDAEINKNIGVDYAIVSDAETFLERLCRISREAKHDAWRAQITEWQTKLDYVPKDDESVIHPAPAAPHGCGGDPGRIPSSQPTLVSTSFGARSNNGRKHVRQFLTSGGLGTMGFGYGAALGAQVAFRTRTVVHITGDGSFHMNP